MTDSPVRVSPDPKLDEEEDSEEWRPEAAEKVQTVTVSPPASCRPTAAAYRSVFTSSTAEELARLYNVPPDYNLHAPKAKERAHAPPPGYAAVYAHHFRYGLMLPLQPFVISVLSHYRIALAQLHPNSIITILGFVELCKTASVDPTVSLFRQFFELRRSTMKTEGWYTVYSIPPSIVPRSFKSKEGEWKSAFLFFKTDQITENLRLSWNYSPNLAPPVAKSDRPSEQTVYQLLAKAKGSSKHHEDEEEGKVIVADARMAVVPKTRSSMNGMQAKKSSTVKLDTTATESLSDVCRQESLKRKADFNEAQHAKIPRAPSFEDMTLEQFAAYTQRCYCSSHLQLQGEKEELEKVLEAKERDIKDGENKVASLQAEKEDMEAKVVSLQRDKEELEKDNASLKAEVSRLQRANGGRGPLLKAVEKVVAAMEQDVKDKNEEICFLETQLKSVVHDQSWLGRGVDDKGPLLKVYSQKLSETQASTRLFYDLTALAQRLGRPESAEQVYDHFPAILPGNSQPVIQPFFPGTNDLNVDEDQDSLAAMRVYSDPELEEDEEWQTEEEDEDVRIVSTPPQRRPTAAVCRSVCTPSTAEKYAIKYNVPPEYGMCAPRADQRAHAPPSGYAAVYTHQFLYGLKLPPPPFMASMLAHYRIALAQLHPAAIFLMLGFMELCKKTSVAPTPALFRHFFRFRKSCSDMNGWYTFYSIIKPKIVQGQPRWVPNWKTSFLFFKTAPASEDLNLPWNHSPIIDPPLADNDRPSEETINRLLANVNSYSKRRIPPREEEGKMSVADARTIIKNAMIKAAAEMPESTPTELLSGACRLKRMAEFDVTEPRKKHVDESSQVLSVPSLIDVTLDRFVNTQKCLLSFYLQLQGDKEELEKAVACQDLNIKEIASLRGCKEELEKENASLKAVIHNREQLLLAVGEAMASKEQEAKDKDEEIGSLKSQLKSAVDDRGPLLRVYTQKLCETRAFGRLFYDLKTLAQGLGRHEAAEQIQNRFPAIPEEALAGLKDPLASAKLDSMLDDAFNFPFLDHLLSLPEIPSSSQLNHLSMDEDHDSSGLN